MRTTSLYVATCHRCGHAIESATREAQCPRCKLMVQMEWPSQMEQGSKDRTISEQYEK